MKAIVGRRSIERPKFISIISSAFWKRPATTAANGIATISATILEIRLSVKNAFFSFPLLIAVDTRTAHSLLLPEKPMVWLLTTATNVRITPMPISI